MEMNILDDLDWCFCSLCYYKILFTTIIKTGTDFLKLFSTGAVSFELGVGIVFLPLFQLFSDYIFRI